MSEQTTKIVMEESRAKRTPARVLQCIVNAGSKGILAREIAECVGGIAKGTAGIHARRLEKQGLVKSELETHPGYKHIIRRRFWPTEMAILHDGASAS